MIKIPASFRDPSGFLFSSGSQLYRQVNRVYQKHYDHLIGSGLYGTLVDLRLLVPHQEVDPVPSPDPADCYKILKPERIPFVSGWHNKERSSLLERGPVDAILALELIHHLAISNNLPFGRMAEFFSQICSWLIIEFVPKRDPQVQRLLSSREDIFVNYTREYFEGALGKHFSLEACAEIKIPAEPCTG